MWLERREVEEAGAGRMRWDDEDVVVPWWQAGTLSTSVAPMRWGRRWRCVHTADAPRATVV